MVTCQRACLFGRIADDEMILNEFGLIAQEEWLRTPAIRPQVRLDAMIIMPNHIHGIIWLNAQKQDVSPTPAHQAQPRNTAAGPAKGSLGALVGQFKTVVGRRINAIRNSAGSQVWQHGYYDRVIRTTEELYAIRAYITANPDHWADDEEWPGMSSTI
jgi:putative transposase